MPATATRRSPTHSLLVPLALALGAVAIGLGPIGCETDDASEEAPAEQNEPMADRSVLLNVGFEDKTDERPPSDQFLVESPKSNRWRPVSLEGGFLTNDFEEYPIGSTYELLIYPEGEAGSRLVVPFSMKPTMSSALASSRTDIVAHDDSIVVTGPAVPDERMTFERPVAESDSR